MILSLPTQTISFESITLDGHGAVTACTPGTAQCFSEKAGSTTLDLVALPGGTFQMGTRHGGYEDERPQHLVSVAPFWMARFPVTQAQWQAVLGKLPPCRFHGPDLPVDNVSWKDSQAFCKKLSALTGREYRLPSEVQWEYACRAGTTTPFHTGATLTTEYANYVGEHLYAQEARGVYRHVPTPAGEFLPNAFGLYDLHGNVWEWCADRWHPDYSGAPFSGEAWESGGEPGWRVMRGGSWHEPPTNCRSATRLRAAEKEPEDFFGFRVILAQPVSS